MTESLVKSKKYLIPMVVASPTFTSGVLAAYLLDGRLKLPKDAPVLDIASERVSESVEAPAVAAGGGGISTVVAAAPRRKTSPVQ